MTHKYNIYKCNIFLNKDFKNIDNYKIDRVTSTQKNIQ